MDTGKPERNNPESLSGAGRAMEMPEDVAVLYDWANLHGAKYRDFSASRREYRAQMRRHAAEQMAEAEMQAQREAEEAARQAAEMARRESAERRAYVDASAREAAMREEAALREEEARRHAEAAAAAQQTARLAQIEEQKAREMAWREAQVIRESHLRAMPEVEEPADPMEASVVDPYERPDHDYTNLEHIMHQPEVREVTPFQKHSGHALHTSYAPQSFVAPQTEPAPMRTHVVPERVSAYEPPQVTAYVPPPPQPRYYEPQPPPPQQYIQQPVQRSVPQPQQPVAPSYAQDLRQRDSTPEYPVYRPAAQAPPPGQAIYEQMLAEPRQTYSPAESFAPYRSVVPQAPPAAQNLQYPPQSYQAPSPPVQQWTPPPSPLPQTWQPAPPSAQYYAPPPVPLQSQDMYPGQAQRPEWLYGAQEQQGTAFAGDAMVQAGGSPLANTLQQSRERVASRWFALKGVFEGGAEEQQAQPSRQREVRTPALAVFSLAGGVGKTSIVATLGRALASLGEKVLLTDTTSYGLLPFYFGARELRPGVVRTFSPPPGSTDAPIFLVNYDTERANEQDPDWLADEITRNSRGCTRILLDLGTGSARLTRRIAKLAPTVLVPVAPDMNSVIGLTAVEKYFADQYDTDGRQMRPLYILNQFDATLPLHLDVREVMRQQLGERLLPFAIRRSPAVSESLAEGMTVMDYAPGSPAAEDFLNLAGWLRSTTAPAVQAFRGTRWSER